MSEFKNEYMQKVNELRLDKVDEHLTLEERNEIRNRLLEIKRELDIEIKNESPETELYEHVADNAWKQAKIGALVMAGFGLTTAVLILMRENGLPTLSLENPTGMVTDISFCFTAIMGTFSKVMKYINKGHRERLKDLVNDKEELKGFVVDDCPDLPRGYKKNRVEEPERGDE